MVPLKTSSKKKNFLILFLIVILTVTISVMAYLQQIPNPGHGGYNVFISINGNNKDLQTAINNGDFNSCSISGTSYSGNITNGHRGEEIIINVNGAIKTLQGAINDSTLTNAQAGTSPSNFGNNIAYGQTGDEIWISINGNETTLQQAINNGSLRCSVIPPTQTCSGTPTQTCSGISQADCARLGCTVQNNFCIGDTTHRATLGKDDVYRACCVSGCGIANEVDYNENGRCTCGGVSGCTAENYEWGTMCWGYFDFKPWGNNQGGVDFLGDPCSSITTKLCCEDHLCKWNTSPICTGNLVCSNLYNSGDCNLAGCSWG